MVEVAANLRVVEFDAGPNIRVGFLKLRLHRAHDIPAASMSLRQLHVGSVLEEGPARRLKDGVNQDHRESVLRWNFGFVD